MNRSDKVESKTGVIRCVVVWLVVNICAIVCEYLRRTFSMLSLSWHAYFLRLRQFLHACWLHGGL